jgi:hypothetical protein
MADPHVLYVVSAVVVLALVAWVIAVTATAPPLVDVRKAPAEPPPSPPPPEPRPEVRPEPEAKADAKAEPEAKSEPDTKAKAAPEPEELPQRPSRSGLHDHLEIQDDPKVDDKSGER